MINGTPESTGSRRLKLNCIRGMAMGMAVLLVVTVLGATAYTIHQNETRGPRLLRTLEQVLTEHPEKLIGAAMQETLNPPSIYSTEAGVVEKGEIIFVTKNLRCSVHRFKYKGTWYLLATGRDSCLLIKQPS